MSISQLRNTVRSQFNIAKLNHSLWSFRHLLGGIQLSRRWFLKANGTAPSPLAMAWYLTHACPEKCDFCNVSRALETEVPALPFNKAKELIDTLVPKIPVVALGGGEPMAHPRVIDIIHHVHKRNGRVFLVTSGTPVGKQKAKSLCQQHPEMIMVSLLGDEAAHDARMGRKGAYARTLATISNLQRYRDPKRTRLIINCTISPNEAHVLQDVVKIAKSLSVDALRFSWLSFMSPTEALKLPVAEPYFILKEKEIRAFPIEALWDQVHQIQKQHSDFVQFLPRLGKEDFYAWFVGSGVKRSCLSLWHTLFVRPDGSVVPCGHMQDQKIGDVLEQPLNQYWNSEKFKDLRLAQRATPFQMCGRCCKV